MSRARAGDGGSRRRSLRREDDRSASIESCEASIRFRDLHARTPPPHHVTDGGGWRESTRLEAATLASWLRWTAVNRTGRPRRAGRQFRDERPFLSRPMASAAAAGTSDSTLRLSSTTLSCSDNGSFLTRHPSIHQHVVGKQTIYEKIKKTNVKLSRP